MGGFIVVVTALLVALLAVLMPFGNESMVGTGYSSRPALQAIASNMIKVHEMVLDFCSAGTNCSTAAEVDLSSRIATNPGTPAFSTFIPSFVPTSGLPVDWRLYNSAGSVVTFFRSTEVAGYTPQQIAHALDDFALSTNQPTWSWGVIASGSVANPAAAALPTDGVVRTTWTDGWVAIVGTYP